MSQAVPSDAGRESGQVLVFMVLGLLIVMAGIALAIDGGSAFARQREAQNSSDAAANAGAIVIAERMAGATEPAGGWDGAIEAAVLSAAASNGVGVAAAYYTDLCGIPLRPNGTAALNGDGTQNLAAAAEVGVDGFPTDAGGSPDCPSLQVGPPVGVMVVANKVVDLIVAPVLGINTMTVTTQSTAVAGYLQSMCAAEEDEGCTLLPITVPVNVISCTGPGGGQVDPSDTPWTTGQVYVVPLCQSGDGNVGWIDWDGGGGGSNEVVGSITTPDNPDIDLPSWQQVAFSGNTNDNNIEDALRAYDGEVVLILQFDLTCEQDPDHGQVSTPTAYGCPSGSGGGSGGTNLWYRIPGFAYFRFCAPGVAGCDSVPNGPATHGAYINGQHDICGGSASCLVGKFVRVISGTGTVGSGVGAGVGDRAVGVQLIR